MKCIETIEQGRRVLELRGDFDSFVAEPFRARVEALIAEGCRALDVDLRMVRFLSTRAVTALLAAKRLAERAGGELRVVGTSEVARWTFATLGVEHVLVPGRAAA